MKVTLINYTGDPNRWQAARLLVFTKRTRLEMNAQQWSTINDMPTELLLKELEYMANTIPSSWEFVDYTFAIEGVTRACTHQMVRTRTASFAQQSMRVTNMTGFNYFMPNTVCGDNKNRYVQAMTDIDCSYRAMIDDGAAEEDARGLLPTNILTNIVGKYNLRTMADLVKSREGGRTQGEYRDVVRAMGDAILSVHPWAALFLYPKGRDHFKELEEATAKVSDRAVRTEILKVIDQMRKA